MVIAEENGPSQKVQKEYLLVDSMIDLRKDALSKFSATLIGTWKS